MSLQSTVAVPTRQPIRVLVVAKIRLYREGLEAILAQVPGLELVGAEADAHAGLARPPADVALVDTALPEGLDAVRVIATAAPQTRIVALAVPEFEHDVIACAEAGISAYVTRDASLSDLVSAIASVARGEAMCSPRMTASLLRRINALASARAPNGAVSPLTPRETQIAALIEQGLSNKLIAHRLGIGLPTVKNHVHSILDKLDARTRTEAVARWRASARLTTVGASRASAAQGPGP